MSELAKKLYAVLGLGKFGSNRYFLLPSSPPSLPFSPLSSSHPLISPPSHPIHPSTVHFPIAFFTTANSLNLLYGLAIYFPSLSPITPDKFNTGALTILGYFANVAGLVTSIPALLTGNAELYAMVQSRGLWVTDQETETRSLEPVVKVTLLHVCLSPSLLVDDQYGDNSSVGLTNRE